VLTGHGLGKPTAMFGREKADAGRAGCQGRRYWALPPESFHSDCLVENHYE
jgi:hypothetical protein